MSTEPGSHARRLARRLGAALDRMATGPERPIRHLEGVRNVREMLDLVEHGLVDAAVRSGYSFGEIGRALGVSRQAVRAAYVKRHAEVDPFDRWVAVQKAKKRRPAA